MKKYLILLFIITGIAAPLFCQMNAEKIFERDWDGKIIDFKKVYRNKGITEKEIETPGITDGKLFTFDDILEHIKIKVAYTFSKRVLVSKIIEADTKDEKELKRLSDLLRKMAVRKLGKPIRDVIAGSSKTTAWRAVKEISAILKLTDKTAVLQVTYNSRIKNTK